MGAFNLSSNPLSTLFPNLSPQQDPNYGNAFQIDLGNLKSTTSPMPDYAKQFAEETQPMLNQMKFKVGLMTSGSSNPAIAFKGKQIADEVVSDMNRKADQFSSIFPTDGSQTPNKPSFFSKMGGWQTVGAAADMLGSFMPEKDEYSGTKGDVTQTLDSAYDNISNTLMAIPGWGTIAGGAMKLGSFLGKGVNALGGGTSGMTTTDAILGSSFLNLTPFGLINGFGGSKTSTITKDEEAFETVGSSYTGTNQTVNDALTKSGKKYGLFSSGARKEANREIEEARRQQEVMADIADEATDRFAIRNSMAAINGNRRKYYLQGGYNQADVRVGKSGMSLDLIAKAKKVLSEPRKLQTGGTAKDPFEYYVSTLPVAQRDSSNFRVRDYWQYNGYPKDFDEAKKRGMFEWVEDFDSNGKSLGWSWHAFTVAKNPNADEYDFMKSSSHPTVQKELDWYNSNSPDAVEFRNNYELQRTEPYWKYVRRKRDTISHKEGGQIQVKPTEIILVEPELIESGIDTFKEGGSINVIPEGALHARKHNMDMEGITPKGIPVVSEKDGEIEQQAEIERNEVILRLEVTQKLEELEKKFYSEESTQEEKDECALEAGKLLVYELLENTIDNTGLLNET